MDEKDKANLVLAAITLGFIELRNDELKCTTDQLCQLCIIVASSAIEQLGGYRKWMKIIVQGWLKFTTLI